MAKIDRGGQAREAKKGELNKDGGGWREWGREGRKRKGDDTTVVGVGEGEGEGKKRRGETKGSVLCCLGCSHDHLSFVFGCM